MKEHLTHYKECFSDSFSIKHKITKIDEKHTFHIHDELELLLVMSEHIKCTVNDKSYFVKPCTLLIFNNMDLHYVSMTQPGISDRYVVYFKPEYIEFLSSGSTNLLECFLFRPFGDANILPLTQRQADSLILLMNRISNIYSLPPGKLYGSDLYLKLYLAELLLKVNTLYRDHHNISVVISDQKQALIYNVINYIHQNYWDELSLDVLASHFLINKFYLCDLFKRVTNNTITQYLISCRMTKAKEFLMNHCSVDETCTKVGYNNLSHFSREFKRKYGLSPKQYQMLHQNSSDPIP